MTQKRILTNNQINSKKSPLNENGDIVYYAELLDQAHKEGLRSIGTRLIQIPTKENQFTAIVIARVKTNKGMFTGHGDASPTNVDPEIAPHIIRAAETRAKARALRDAVNVGMVALDELGGNNHEQNVEKALQGIQTQKDSEKALPKIARNGEEGVNPESRPIEPERPMTERQRAYLFRIMAQRGLEGDTAHGELKKAFRVNSLKEVTMHQASMIIEELKKYLNNGEGGG
ncbi:MAG: hypothetical protein L0Y56_21680 [Nitrospira sp.]|nr:hypothetical protein [Nitrospira sp.]